MALDPKLIQFFFSRINNADLSTLVSSCAQMFTHLQENAKDNPIYDTYEKNSLVWSKWIEDLPSSSQFALPRNFDDSKSLAYSLYKKLSLSADDGFGILFQIVMNGDINQAIHEFNSLFIEYFGKALDEIIAANPEVSTDAPTKAIGTRVFIIHGHDSGLKTEVQLLLNRAGVNSLVLHEQPDRGRTIIDKLIGESEDSNYAIGLFTPDDIVNTGENRARQNVILEIGYFLGRLGKERVRMIVKGEVEIPSDLHGILYQKYDTAGAWKLKILKELQAVGIYVDLSAVMQTL